MSDELDIDGIRAEHVASGDPADPHCAMCSDASYPIWPCDTAIVLERLGALEAERDRFSDLATRQQALNGELLAERDALAAAEAALWAVGVPLINNVMCWCQESRDMAYGHSDACRQANAALAGSRRQARGGGVMRTVGDSYNELQRVTQDWVRWAQRLEALVLATPVPCRCWDNNGRNGTQGHIGLCNEWSAVAAAIRTKPKMVAGPPDGAALDGSREQAGNQARSAVSDSQGVERE